MDSVPSSRLWWIPLVFALLVAGVGGYAYRTLADAMRANLRSNLETILEAEVAALRLWGARHEAATRAAARSGAVRRASAELAELLRTASSRDAAGEALRGSPASLRLHEALAPVMEEHGYRAYALLTPESMVLASNDPRLAGRRLEVSYGLFEEALGGGVSISTPRPGAGLPADGEEAPPAVIRIGAGVAQPGASEEMLAVLGFTVSARTFSEVMHLARPGESGETYAFSEDALMVSHSRFGDQLRELGILEPEESSILNVELRDPGGNLAEGFVPTLPMLARPLTRMAAAAIAREPGIDLDGYNDYRGVPVVGAWAWVEEFGLGVATEIDLEEAYAGLATVQRSFAAIAGLFAIGALGMLAYTVVLGRVQARYETARKLGRYRIQEKIGEGGMGKVYRARHALLRRPTAVKLLDSSRANPEAVQRFEREVQAAASLTHPNTIAIFDYGHTPDGTFYYAMEYLDGITVGQLIELDGPQPEARAVHLMQQAASSVAEAHGTDLIHRDLKPSNLMLCQRGGILDFVKVLDFGLVRARDEDLHLTTAESLTGTPLYLSPEALESPDSMDARSDVYQLGAILYTLLTGRPVFEGRTLVEVLSQHLNSSPIPPSELLGRQVAPDLEKLVLACLAKDPDQRPADGAELGEALEGCVIEEVWTQTSARAWWSDWMLRHPGGLDPLGGEGGSTGTLPSDWQVDVGGRSGGTRG